MAASPSRQAIMAKIRRLQKKNPGQKYVVLHASNGEVAIVTKEWFKACTGKDSPGGRDYEV